MSARIDPKYARQLKDDPESSSEAIVTAACGLDALIQSLPKTVEVRYRYHLIQAVAVVGRGADILALSALPGIKSIETVGDVRASSKDQ